ncbi:MAG: rod shape-determining protein RodA [Bacteroidetes bacterium]|nr:rod shape-determining protein RodA [Bacteroidota bacterium]
MREQGGIFKNLDPILVTLYLIMVLMGWLNIYASVYNEEHQSIVDFTQKYGKQLIWIATALLLAIIILILDGNFYAAFSYPIYGISIISLILVLFIGKEISGSKSWFRLGEFGIQPAEFAKFATNMALAKFLSNINIKMTDARTKVISAALIILPILLILVENETGCALVFFAFILVLYREGLSGNILLLGSAAAILFVLALLINKFILIGIIAGVALLLILVVRRNRSNLLIIMGSLIFASATIYSVDYAFNHLEPHQKKRINVFLGKETDKKKAGYNVNQSLIAIGSGGFTGKGYLQGTQTKYDFVPEQSTDFIFCTVGEEWGFIGTFVVITLFIVLLLRIIFIAERQRSPYTRIYGYGVASILFFHVLVNVGMTIGLAPVIGIPLPFFSYGGSSLWSFTVLLFIFIKMDAYRLQVLR